MNTFKKIMKRNKAEIKGRVSGQCAAFGYAFFALWMSAKRLIYYLLLLDEPPYFRRVVYGAVLWFLISGFLVGFFATWLL